METELLSILLKMLLPHRMTAVSYTHLDVYKRQVRGTYAASKRLYLRQVCERRLFPTAFRVYTECGYRIAWKWIVQEK